jgi:phosphonate transport system permease protein
MESIEMTQTQAMEMDAADATLRSGTITRFARKKLTGFAVMAALLVYAVYIFFAFDIIGLAERARMDNAAILVSDAVTYKTHVTRDNRNGRVTVAVEGSRRATYGADQIPDWVTITETTTEIQLRHGHYVTYEGPVITYVHPDLGPLRIDTTDGIDLQLPTDEIPDFISASSSRISINTEAGRLTVTRARTETMRYFAGWELFFFDLSSPYAGMSFAQVMDKMMSSDRLDPNRSNIGLMVGNVWNNGIWRHGEVAWAMGETVLMAFLGTFGAALIALPLAFLAAGNFAPSRAVRFVMRRIFDFVRGVDALIFTIILSRAFGPGPLTGALAILVSDTGGFGKLFSEALENVDNKQIEGLASTGANAVQRSRFGVLPQVMPILLSQVLYLFESNTRSATIVGAIVGGGIGLMLTQAIQTTQDWEKVSYYIILIVLLVIAMDALSGWLRRKLIKGE